METTIIIAKVLGVYFIVSGVFVMLRRKTLMNVLKDIFEHRAISYIIGFILTIGGAALVIGNPAGSGALAVFVTIMSWAILIKGVTYIFFPEWLHAMTKHLPISWFVFIGAIITVLGVYLVAWL